MPERAFVTQNIPELEATAATLEKALRSGNIEELRVSGIVTRVGAVSQKVIELRYKQVRYEIYLCITNMDGSAERTALIAKYGETNPYQERVMRVEQRHSCHVFPSQLP